jgi:hypothetical protein
MISGPSLLRCAVGLICLLALACTDRPDPIILDEGIITVENQTDSEWKDVRVVVNDYFGGSVPSLAPGARLNAMLSNMQTGFGQRFDRGRMSVRKIEVTATDASGKPVNLTWERQAVGPVVTTRD